MEKDVKSYYLMEKDIKSRTIKFFSHTQFRLPK